jgi:hypothetical protein
MILLKNDSVKITRIPGFAAPGGSEPCKPRSFTVVSKHVRVYAKTGKGHLESVGVSELLELKQDYLARSLAGHIVAGVATDEDIQAFQKFCASLG